MTALALAHAIVAALAVLLAALGLGHCILRLLRVEERGAAGLWLAATCGLGALSVVTLLLGGRSTSTTGRFCMP